ncbi:MAG: flagellar hook-associated protein FlgK [Phycisphaerae bacterium]
MANFEIGISGLTAAQKSLDIIGNNIANAATPGYHKQRLDLNPAYCAYNSATIIGGGVDARSITRMIDNLLEKELLRQNSILTQIAQERTTLQTIENTFGELAGSGGLNAAIDRMFNAFADLTGHVGEIIWQQQVVAEAEMMASQFRSMGDILSKLDQQITLESEHLIERANTLITQIAKFNDDIERIEITGGVANNLRDHRDQLITQLSEIIGVQTIERRNGVVDVEAGGIAVVIGTSYSSLEAGIMEEGGLGITIQGASNYTSNVHGGRIGALISLKNNIIGGIRENVDTLATTVISQVNQYHVQGIGSAGSFNRLDGWAVSTTVLADWVPPITDGKINIRVTDISTGDISRTEINLAAIVPSNPSVGLTLEDVAAEINDITGLNCWVDSSGLHLERSSANYKFDFLPEVLPEPTDSTLTGTSVPNIAVSGVYTGTENDTFTFTVSGAGTVGNGVLELVVTNSDGQAVKTLNIGSGYAAGDILEVGNGIRISIGVGDFGVDDNFEVDAFSSTDTSGLLAAAGVNTFFKGTGASDITVCSDIIDNPARVAASLSSDGHDNANVSRFAQLSGESLAELGNLTIGDYYRKLVTDIGQELSIRQVRQDSIEASVKNLQNQRSEISGVDINEQAAQLLVFQQMFQSMAKYMSVVQNTLDSIMSIV